MTEPLFLPADEPAHGQAQYNDGRVMTPPREEIVAAFLTIVAKFQGQYGVGLLGYALMGTHDHLIPFARDPTKASNVALFKQQVHSVFAKWLQVFWGIDDEIYSKCVTDQLFPVLGLERLLETIAYVEQNPVKDGLVWSTDELPTGTVSAWGANSEPILVPRPEKWFRAGKWPSVAEIRLEVPEWLLERHNISREQFAFRAAHASCRAKLDYQSEQTRKPMGLEWLQAQSPTVERNPQTGKKRKKRRNLKKVLCAGNARDCARFYLRRRRFLRMYRKCRKLLSQGRGSVEFPYGTLQMVLSHGYPMRAGPA